MHKEFFPRQIKPQVYAYEDTNPNHKGLLKIGYTTKVNVEERVAEQFPVITPDKMPYKIVFSESTMREDGSYFTDHDVHKLLEKQGFDNVGGEWFKCSVRDIQSAVFTIKIELKIKSEELEILNFCPEQTHAIDKTIKYFKSIKAENPKMSPHFLWNAKMRFGKLLQPMNLPKLWDLKKF